MVVNDPNDPKWKSLYPEEKLYQRIYAVLTENEGLSLVSAQQRVKLALALQFALTDADVLVEIEAIPKEWDNKYRRRLGEVLKKL